MSFDFRSWSTGIRGLCDALAALRSQAEAIGAPSPERDEWYQLLLNKLRPQSFGEPPLVVAVVGGTNIGKSAIFNQLAGEDASSVSPLAAGTKHPVCLAPPGTDDALLRALFAEFTLRPWSAAADALSAADEHLLFYRESPAVPERLLLLDTPDIDSDAQVNWQRADAVRQTADVLIGVLTQQKYNDAAVKKFFTRAAEADKAVILVFNQVDLALDREIWPTWLDVFQRDTGIRPVRTYVVPYDRRASQARGLTFHDIGGPTGDATADVATSQEPSPTDLGRELAELRYEDLKARTLRGALRRVVDPQTGVDRYLARVRESSREYAEARDELEKAQRVAASWPGLPGSVLIQEVLRWWDERRSPFTRKVHGAYRALGRTVVDIVHLRWPGATEEVDVLAEYHKREENSVGEITDALLEKLQTYATIGNSLLRDRLKTLLGGDSRRRMLDEVKRAYAELPAMGTQFRERLAARLTKFEQEQPKTISKLRALDTATAALRPAISLTLLASGVGTGLDMAGFHVIGSTLVNETVIAAATGEGTAGAARFGIRKTIETLLRDVQIEHAAARAEDLAQILNKVILGGLLAELRRGADVATGPEMRAATEASGLLRTLAK